MDKLILPKGATMAIPSPLAKKLGSVRNTENMTTEELLKFMKKHGFNERTFAEFFGITVQGARLWISGQREISKTNTRILRMLDLYPQLIAKFQEL